jgi:hypothetical protein
MNEITPEELVRYLYKETSVQKTARIEAALDSDWNLRETYEKLRIAHVNLPNTQLSPRPEAVNAILEYASKRNARVASH